MKQPQMNVKRLQRLRKELSSLKPTKHRQFDMQHWFKATVSAELDDMKVEIDSRGACKVKPIKPECGTCACALGHAALIPEFQRAGLRLRVGGGLKDGSVVAEVRFGRDEGVDAGAKFFGLTENEAEHLFIPNAYYVWTNNILPRDVVKHIDEVIRGDFR